jgi:hypothetical protein
LVGAATLALFATYTAWTFTSLLRPTNQGDAWVGSGQILLYLLAFWLTLALVSLGASRRWVHAASTLGPATVTVFTLPGLDSRVDEIFENDRLLGT